MIGILGAYGEIGKYTTNILCKNYKDKIYLMGRNAKSAINKEEFSKNIEVLDIDIFNGEDIKKYLLKCDVLINCSGQTGLLNEAEFKYKGIYIDVNLRHSDFKTYGKSIFSCGSIPGLSGVLCDFISKEFDEINSLEFYYSGIGKFSYTSAADYLDGVLGQDFTKVDDKNQNYNILNESPNYKLMNQNSQNKAKYYPYFDEECKYVVNNLNLKNASFFTMMDGINLSKALEDIRNKYNQNRELAIKTLVNASTLDSINFGNQLNYTIEAKGYLNKEKIVKTLILESKNPSRITGEALASLVLAILENKDINLRTDDMQFFEFEDSKIIVKNLLKNNKYIQLDILDDSIENIFNFEEGEI